MNEDVTVVEPEQPEPTDVGVDHLLPESLRSAIILLTIVVTYGFFSGLWALFAILAYNSSGLVGGAVFGAGSLFIGLLGVSRVVAFVR